MSSKILQKDSASLETARLANKGVSIFDRVQLTELQKRLTPTQVKVVELVTGNGLSAKEAASALGIKLRTVQNHIQEVRRRLELSRGGELSRAWQAHQDQQMLFERLPKLRVPISIVEIPDEGLSLSYVTYGNKRSQATPILCLEPPHYSHLVYEWAMDWNHDSSKLNTLARGRMVVRFDPRGSGLSSRDVKDQSLSARTKDLEAVAVASGLARLDSDGSYIPGWRGRFAIYAPRNSSLVALNFAAQHPDLVSLLTLDQICVTGAEYWTNIPYGRLLALAEEDWDAFLDAHAFLSYVWWSQQSSSVVDVTTKTVRRSRAYLRSCINQQDFITWANAERNVSVDNIHWDRIVAPVLLVGYRRGGRLFNQADASSQVDEAARLLKSASVFKVEADHLEELLERFLRLLHFSQAG